jgi:hypothetical protein
MPLPRRVVPAPLARDRLVVIPLGRPEWVLPYLLPWRFFQEFAAAFGSNPAGFFWPVARWRVAGFCWGGPVTLARPLFLLLELLLPVAIDPRPVGGMARIGRMILPGLPPELIEQLLAGRLRRRQGWHCDYQGKPDDESFDYANVHFTTRLTHYFQVTRRS